LSFDLFFIFTKLVVSLYLGVFVIICCTYMIVG